MQIATKSCFFPGYTALILQENIARTLETFAFWVIKYFHQEKPGQLADGPASSARCDLRALTTGKACAFLAPFSELPTQPC
jgi:hypothetical protein